MEKILNRHSKSGNAYPPLIGVVLLCLIPVDGEPAVCNSCRLRVLPSAADAVCSEATICSFPFVDILANHEADAVLIIGTDLGAHFPRATVEHLANINTIVLDPFISLSTAVAKLHIPVASVGIDAEGTAYRLDGVPIHVKKAFESEMPSDEVILTRILEEVRRLKAERK